MDAHLAWIAIGILIALVGVVGLVLPALPGAPLLFLGFLIIAWAEHFAYVGRGTLAVLGGLAALAWGADYAAGAFGARRFGASRRAVYGAALGALVGLFFGLPGVVLGPFIGAVLGELSARRNLRAAGRAGLGASLGVALGAAAKLALGLVMVGVFLLARFAG